MLNPDGSEDNNFCFIQTDGVATQTREELSQGVDLLTQDKGDNHPFVDCEDDKELETNKTVIDNDTD